VDDDVVVAELVVALKSIQGVEVQQMTFDHP